MHVDERRPPPPIESDRVWFRTQSSYGRKYADIQIYTVSFQIASLVQNAVALPLSSIHIRNTSLNYKCKSRTQKIFIRFRHCRRACCSTLSIHRKVESTSRRYFARCEATSMLRLSNKRCIEWSNDTRL